jgi:hypothetical protein
MGGNRQNYFALTFDLGLTRETQRIGQATRAKNLRFDIGRGRQEICTDFTLITQAGHSPLPRVQPMPSGAPIRFAASIK